MPSRITPERNFSAPPTFTEKSTLPRPPLVWSLLSTPAMAREPRARPGQAHDDLAGRMAVKAARVFLVHDVHRPAAPGVLLHRAVIGEHHQRGLSGCRQLHALEFRRRPPPRLGQLRRVHSHIRSLGSGNQKRAKDQSVSQGSHGLVLHKGGFDPPPELGREASSASRVRE